MNDFVDLKNAILIYYSYKEYANSVFLFLTHTLNMRLYKIIAIMYQCTGQIVISYQGMDN